MKELLEQIAAARGYPSDLVQRAAQARAKAMGVSTETVVAQWAGVEGSDVPAPAAAPSGATQAAPPAAPQETAAPEAPKVEVLAPAEPEVVESAPVDEPDPEPEPAGLVGGFPGWLAAAFLIIPTIAVVYALSLPNGPACGSAGQLAVDPETGVATNCDGSEYGVEVANFFATGRTLYDANCASCHGAGGGGGAGPALSGGAVVATFGACEAHIQWVALATAGWPDPTYGDTNKPVGGGGNMPGFEGILTEAELATVTLYERVQFGELDLAASEADCGLAEAAVAAP